MDIPFQLPALLADPPPPDQAVVVTDVVVFDGTGSSPVETEAVVTQSGRIVDMTPPSGATFVRGEGRFLMPGLIDAHSHLGEPIEPILAAGMEPLRPAVRDHLVASETRKALRMGITTIRDVGTRGDPVLAMRQAIRHGAFLGPRILTCARIVSATAAGGRQFEGMYREADGPDEMRKAAREQLRRGADFVKIMVTGARSVELENPAPPQVSQAELAALVEEVHRQGYRVAAHCEGLEGTILAIEEGVDTVEHGFYLNQAPRYLDEMAVNGQTLVPTLTFLHDVVDQTHEPWSRGLIERGEYNLDQAVKTLESAVSAGVNIAMGYDSAPEERAASELARMVDAGMEESAALAAATSGSATALGLEDKIGSIGEGMLADLVLVDGSPIQDITVLSEPDRISLVVRNGHLAHADPDLLV